MILHLSTARFRRLCRDRRPSRRKQELTLKLAPAEFLGLDNDADFPEHCVSRPTPRTHDSQFGKHRIGRHALTEQPPDFHPLVIVQPDTERSRAPFDNREIVLGDRCFGEANPCSTP